MTLRLTTPASPTEADRDAVLAPLRAYNLSRGGNPRVRPVAVLLTDASGEPVGGLWGRCSYDWLFVEYLAVPEEHRDEGHGRALMLRADDIARESGCVGVWLDTFAFQARGFYEKLGFELFGTLEDHPVGQRRHFLSKRL